MDFDFLNGSTTKLGAENHSDVEAYIISSLCLLGPVDCLK